VNFVLSKKIWNCYDIVITVVILKPLSKEILATGNLWWFWNDLKIVPGSVPLSGSHGQSDGFTITFSCFKHIFLSLLTKKTAQPRNKNYLNTNCAERTVKLDLDLRRNTLKMVIYLRGQASPQSQLYTKCCYCSTSGMCFYSDINFRDSEPVSEFSSSWKWVS